MQRLNTKPISKNLFQKNSELTGEILAIVSKSFPCTGLDVTRLDDKKNQESLLFGLNDLNTKLTFQQFSNEQFQQICKQLGQKIPLFNSEQLQQCFHASAQAIVAINECLQKNVKKERVNIDAVVVQCIAYITGFVYMLSLINSKQKDGEENFKKNVRFIIDMIQLLKANYRIINNDNTIGDNDQIDNRLIECYDRLLPDLVEENTHQSISLARQYLKNLKALLQKPQYAMRWPLYYSQQCSIALKENNFHKFKHYLYKYIACHENIPNKMFISISKAHVDYLSKSIPQFLETQQYKEALLCAQMRQECIALSIESYKENDVGNVRENESGKFIVGSTGSKESRQQYLKEWQQEEASESLSVAFIKRNIAERHFVNLLELKNNYSNFIQDVCFLDESHHHVKIQFKDEFFLKTFASHLRFSSVFFKQTEDSLIIDTVLSHQPHAKLKIVFDRLATVLGAPISHKESQSIGSVTDENLIKISKLEQAHDFQNDNNAQENNNVQAQPKKQGRVISWGEQYPVYEEGNLNCGVFKLYGIGEHYYVCINPDLLQEIYTQDHVLAEELITICERGKVLGNSQGGKGFILSNHDLSDSGASNKKERNKRSHQKNKKKNKSAKKKDKELQAGEVNKPKYAKVKDCTEDSRVFGKENVPKVTIEKTVSKAIEKKDYHLIELNAWRKTHHGKVRFFAWPENITKEEVISAQTEIKSMHKK